MQWLLNRGRVPFLIAAGCVTLLLAYQCIGLQVDGDNRSMDADNVAQKAIETEFNVLFEESDSIFIAVHRENILDPAGRELIRGMADEFRTLNGVEKVVSLADSDFEVAPYQTGLLISEDGKTTGIRLLLGTFSDNGETLRKIIKGVDSVIESRTTADVKIAMSGLPVQKYEVGRLVRKDQKMFAPLSLLILGGVLLVVTRRVSGMIFPLLVSVLTICWTLGIYAWTGNSLNMITSLLPPVIMTLSVATTIHIYLDWLRCTEPDNQKRILKAVGNLYRPCLFASLTTAIGFLSLLLSNTPAVRLFGIFAALGVAIAYLLGVIGIAVGLSFIKPPSVSDTLEEIGSKHSILDRLLEMISQISIHHPRKVILITLILGGLSIFGLVRIESDTDLLHFLGDDSPLVTDTEFIDHHLAGVSSIDLFVKSKNGEPIDDIAPVAEFQKELSSFENIRHTLSFADLIPDSVSALIETGVPLAEVLSAPDFRPYVNEESTKFRITVNTDSIGTHKGRALVDKILEAAHTHLGEKFEIHPVGGFYRVIVESDQLVTSQVKSFVIAIALILIAIGVVFRSFVYTLLAIIPNVVPLLLTAAMMGFSGIALSTGTAMIASVVIGIAVDDTIHYMSAYRKSRLSNRDEVLHYTTRSTGFVLLATTMALSAGFWVAVFGSFQPTIYFASLAGTTMWFALACDLIVLPSFLKLAAPNHEN